MRILSEKLNLPNIKKYHMIVFLHLVVLWKFLSAVINYRNIYKTTNNQLCPHYCKMLKNVRNINNYLSYEILKR